MGILWQPPVGLPYDRSLILDMNSVLKSLSTSFLSISFSSIAQLLLSRSSQLRHFLAVASPSIQTAFRSLPHFSQVNTKWSPVSVASPQCLHRGLSAFPTLYVPYWRAPLLVLSCELWHPPMTNWKRNNYTSQGNVLLTVRLIVVRNALKDILFK